MLLSGFKEKGRNILQIYETEGGSAAKKSSTAAAVSKSFFCLSFGGGGPRCALSPFPFLDLPKKVLPPPSQPLSP